MIEYLTQACSVSWGKGEIAARPELEALKQRLWVTIIIFAAIINLLLILFATIILFAFWLTIIIFLRPFLFLWVPNILLIFLRLLYQLFLLDHDCE